jgi:hypothetical protein
MRVAELITASILIVLSGLVLLDAVRLGMGWGPDGPNSGFFPFWLALIMLVNCVVIFVQGARGKTHQDFFTRANLRLVLTVLVPAAVAVLLIQVVGLYVASALYLGFYMRWVGRNSWSAILAVSIIVPVSIFFIFEEWFLVPMPKGPLEAWLGY